MRDQDSILGTGFKTADLITRQTAKTGISELDDLLGGGLESGLAHLFYGDRSLHNDLLTMAVHIQRQRKDGGLESPTIVIDSANMIKIEQITDCAYEFELEPEDVMDNIYISRAFNSSQTYDLVMAQLEDFFTRIPARLLIVTGLPNLYVSEGVTGERLQELTHMATKLMTFTLQRGIFTLISAERSERNKWIPAGGKALASYTQVHVLFEESKSYFKYLLTKHPQYPPRRAARVKPFRFGATLPLSHFLGGEGEQEE